MPLDFDNSIVIRSEYCYPFLQDLIRKPIVGQVTVGILLISVWIIGATIRFGIVVQKLVLLQKFRKQSRLEPNESKLMHLSLEISKELNYDANEIHMCISSTATTAYQAGFLRPFILLPVNIYSFTEDEICHMLRHELCHFLGRDLWIKVSLKIMTCILWWNPVMILLNNSVEQMLELRCDQHACQNMTKEKQLSYLETLMHLAKNNVVESSSLSLGYVGNNENQNIIQRFKLIIAGSTHTFPSLKVIFSLTVCLAIFISSYIFILQPWTAPHFEEESSTVALNSETSCIIQMPDNKFNLYIGGTYICSLSEDELAQEPFCDYVIYRGGLSNEETQNSSN